MACGLVLLDKPKGVTSQQAIYHLRKKLSLPKTIKIGHGGTLDPLATGMLVIALGSATKFLGYLLNANKTYRVTAKLGQVTTTLDAEGEVLRESSVPEFNNEQFLHLFQKFTGQIEQIPPMYSALKFQGKPLYYYARKGQEITRASRLVHIYNLNLVNIGKEEFSFISQVSKGTYIRSLVHDMGQLLGCGAHVQVLHRSQVDPFQENQMVSIDKVDLAHLLPVDTLFSHLPLLRLSANEIKKLKSGQKLHGLVDKAAVDQFFRLYEVVNNQFVGLVKMNEQMLIKGEKWV